MATLYDLQTKLDKVNSFIDDITSVRRFRSGFGDVFEKYNALNEDKEFANDLNIVSSTRNGFEAVLTKYSALKVTLQRDIIVAKRISDEALANPNPRTEEIVTLREEVVVEPIVTTTKKKKSKK